MTNRQEEYLLLFAVRSSSGGCIANASEEFGVSKATASHLSTALEEIGHDPARVIMEESNLRNLATLKSGKS